MEVKDLITDYISVHYMMQLATVNDNQPWCSTVYYVSDDKLNLYWLSLPTRRHSQEREINDTVASAIPINFVNGEKVVGIQIEGSAKKLESNDSKRSIIEEYAKQFNRTTQWVNDFCNNKTDHRLYKLTPRLIVLFDEVNFPKQPRQEYYI
jgi:uncharacterized protein YhbP (UPF0306 family)